MSDGRLPSKVRKSHLSSLGISAALHLIFLAAVYGMYQETEQTLCCLWLDSSGLILNSGRLATLTRDAKRRGRQTQLSFWVPRTLPSSLSTKASRRHQHAIVGHWF